MICLVWEIGSFLILGLSDKWSTGASALVCCMLLGLVMAGIRMLDRQRRTIALPDDGSVLVGAVSSSDKA